MSKSTIGKLVVGLVFAIMVAIMIANNVYRAFDFIPFGTYVVSFGFLIVWGITFSIMSRYGFYDWWHKK